MQFCHQDPLRSGLRPCPTAQVHRNAYPAQLRPEVAYLMSRRKGQHIGVPPQAIHLKRPIVLAERKTAPERVLWFPADYNELARNPLVEAEQDSLEWSWFRGPGPRSARRSARPPASARLTCSQKGFLRSSVRAARRPDPGSGHPGRFPRHRAPHRSSARPRLAPSPQRMMGEPDQLRPPVRQGRRFWGQQVERSGSSALRPRQTMPLGSSTASASPFFLAEQGDEPRQKE